MSVRLSKEQVNFIEDYLIKNGVKFWDIRIELLDHIAIEVEYRMQNGETFDHALKQVHLAFGNKYRSKKLSNDRSYWIFNDSIYADNSGYKKLILEKQKELNRGFRKSMRSNLVSLLKNPVFWLVYGMVGYFLFQWIQHSANTDFIGKVVLISFITIPAIQMAIPFLLCFKGAKQSLYLGILYNFSFFLMSMPNIMLYWWTKPAPWVYFFLYLVFVPILTAQTIMIVQHSKKYKEFYLKWNKAS